VFEDEKTLAFLDIHPSNEGHTLVITKKQVEFIWDLEDEDYQALMTTVKKVGRRLRETLGVPYVGVKVVGTDVPHVHVHLVPFASTSEYNRGNASDEPDHEMLGKLAQKLAF
jgi:histidine triad (HIT) family protein